MYTLILWGIGIAAAVYLSHEFFSPSTTGPYLRFIRWRLSRIGEVLPNGAVMGTIGRWTWRLGPLGRKNPYYIRVSRDLPNVVELLRAMTFDEE